MFGFGQSWSENRRFVIRHLREFGFGTKSKMETNSTDELQYFIETFDKNRDQNNNDICVHQIFKLSALNLLWRILCDTRIPEDDENVKSLISMAERTIANISIGSQPKFAFPFLRYIPGVTDTAAQLEAITRLQNFLRVRKIHIHCAKVSETNSNVNYWLQGIIESRRETGEYKNFQNDFIDSYLNKIDESRENPHTTFTGKKSTYCSKFKRIYYFQSLISLNFEFEQTNS